MPATQKQILRSAYPTDMSSAGPQAAPLRMTLLKRELLRDDSSRALKQMRIAENSCSQSSRRKLLFVLYALGPYGLLHLVAVQAAESVESRGLVALGESGIVEDGVDKVFDRAAERS